jgi:polar amino acid transport system substrate-binding protein
MHPFGPARCQLLLALAATCFLIAGPAIAKDDSMVMAIPAKGWPPYIIAEKTPRGIMVDVMRQIAATANLEIQFINYPDKRALMRLCDGTVDAYPKSRDWVTAPDEFLWTDPVLESQDLLLFRKGEKWDFDRPQEGSGEKIGCVLGYRYPVLKPFFASDKIKRVNAPNSRSMLLMLSRGRTDAAVVNKNVALWLMEDTFELSGNDFEFADHPLETAPYAFAFTQKKEWKPFIAHFNRELAAMKKDGRLQAILDKYR